MLTRIRSNVLSWVGRKYVARTQKEGFDLSKMPFLPDSVLLPIRRAGLDPVPDLGSLRAKEPISRLPLPLGVDIWLVTGYAEAKAVLGGADSFSNDFGNLVGAGAQAEQNPGGLGFSDPPDHTRLRRLLTPEFTMRRLGRLTPRIHTIVEERLDALAAAEEQPVDLVREFAFPIPSLVICELLGVPYADRAEFQQLSTARFDLFAGANASFDAISESLDYLLRVVRQQRAEPGDGLLGTLVKEHGDAIDDRELAGLADGVLTGGLETTASMLALGTLVLLRDPEWCDAIRADDAAVDRFVEELLRYLTVVQVAFPRFAKADVEVAGTTVAEGDVVLCSLSGANRDPALGSDMESFVPDRSAPSHLAFGHGVHRCVGAELARMELRAAFPALLRRFPEMRLAVRPDRLSFRKLSVVYGVDALPLHLYGSP